MQPNNAESFNSIEREVRNFDPLETVHEGYDDRRLVDVAQRDITRIDSMLATDPTLTAREKTDLYKMGANLRLDWLYAEHGGRNLPMPAFVGKLKETEGFMKRAADNFYAQHEHHPQDFWKMQTKLLDLRTYAAHRYAADSQTTLKGTPAEKRLFGFSEDIMKSVLVDSITLMQDMESFSSGNSTRAKDARGALYELMLLTYKRLEAYQDQSFDTVFIRSALSREDRPWNQHAFPKRAFDMVVQAPGDVDLIQAKNHQNYDEYAQPIRKVQDTDFGQTLIELPRYIKDFKILLNNSSDPNTSEILENAQDQLDAVFGRQLDRTASSVSG